jgi:hypothetical protein
MLGFPRATLPFAFPLLGSEYRPRAVRQKRIGRPRCWRLQVHRIRYRDREPYEPAVALVANQANGNLSSALPDERH